MESVVGLHLKSLRLFVRVLPAPISSRINVCHAQAAGAASHLFFSSSPSQHIVLPIPVPPLLLLPKNHTPGTTTIPLEFDVITKWIPYHAIKRLRSTLRTSGTIFSQESDVQCSILLYSTPARLLQYDMWYQHDLLLTSKDQLCA